MRLRLAVLAGSVAVVAGGILLLQRSAEEPVPEPAAETAAPSAEPPASAPNAPAAEEAPAVPLRRLLAPAEPAQRIDPLRGAPPGPVAGPDPEPGSRLDLDAKRRSSVSHRGTRVDDTDVGVAVPVGESVSVRGGVRVQERDTTDEPEAETRPVVGIEIKR